MLDFFQRVVSKLSNIRIRSDFCQKSLNVWTSKKFLFLAFAFIWFRKLSKFRLSIRMNSKVKKERRNDTALYYTIFFDFNGTVLHADANYDVWRLLGLSQYRYIQYGTDIWNRHKVCTDKRCIHMCADYRTDIPYWNMIHICMYSTLYIWCRQTDQPFSTDIPYTVHTYVLNQKKKWKGSRGHMTHMAWLTFSLGQKGHNR